MPRFTYRAKDTALRVVEGTIDAETEASAISQLGGQGVFPISIAESVPTLPSAPGFFSRRVSQQALTYTTRQLADLLGGGLPLLSALTLLAGQTEQPALQRVIESIVKSVRDGQSLSEALAEHPSVFPLLYVSMIRAGEAGGGLEQALARLAELGESEAELRSRVSSAAAYPLLVLCVAFGMTIFLMVYVVPQLSLVFVESGQLLPLPTRLLLEVSQLFTHWWWALAGGLAIAMFAVRQWYASPQGRMAVDHALVSIPGIGVLMRKLDTARLTRNLGVMVSQGVPVLQALEVVARSISNSVLRKAVAQVQNAVREGSSIAAALGATGQFPQFVSNMVAVGEESGTVDAALLKVAAVYERETDRTIQLLTTILGPVLLLAVGGVVMFIVLAMLLPVFQSSLVVR